ncbi:MAG: hypothetical protein WC003_13340 [Terrimicrobiaceae bacterium]
MSRGGKLVGEHGLRELGSLLETGFLRGDDLCREPETGELVPLGKFLGDSDAPGFSPRQASASAPPGDANPPHENHRRRSRRKKRLRIPPILPLSALAIAAVAALWAIKMSADVAGLQKKLAAAEAANSALNKKFHDVLFAARDVAADGQVRGRVIIRDAGNKRVSLPGIKVRLYRRSDIEAHLAARQADIAEAEGGDPARLALHFLKNLPEAIEVTSTNSDGRFEFQIPEPGEYVIQTGIRSGKTGAMRLWFVAFDSRDPLNTAVDITESNAVRQFTPLLMLVEGR